jgi:2-keto-3-deoxy-L-rhamnonate aldolase RhmA
MKPQETPRGLRPILLLAAACGALTVIPALRAADEPQNSLIQMLAAGKPAIGIWSGTTPSTRATRVLATSDADFIVADIEHEIYDFPTLHRFVLEVADFSQRYRATPKPMPAILVKLGHRGGWDPRQEIAETMRVGPVTGVWVPIVESGAEMARIVSTYSQSEQTALEGVNVSEQGGHTAASPLWPLNHNGRLMVVAMIETDEGVKNAEEIIRTPGVAAIHTVHISEPDSAKVLKLCLQYHVIPAVDANPNNVKAKLAAGYKLLSLGWDYGLMQQKLTENMKAVRAATMEGVTSTAKQ